jgi:hypothetical protein
LTEDFPLTSNGAQWAGYTDRVMGGWSTGNLSRENFAGRACNVLRGHVSLANNGGFVQMATNLTPESRDNGAAVNVDVSDFTGVELDLYYSSGEEDTEQFNVQ